MAERTRTRARTSTRPAASGSGGFFEDPDAPGGMATVTHASYAELLPVAQMSVAQVRDRFRDRLDIDPGAAAIVDGQPAGEDTIIQAGQLLTFVRQSGEKGGGLS